MIQSIVRTNGRITSWNEGEQVFRAVRVAGKITSIQSYMGKYQDDSLIFNYDVGGLFTGVVGNLRTPLLPLFIAEAGGAVTISADGQYLVDGAGNVLAVVEVTPYVAATASAGATLVTGPCELAGYDCTVAAGNITIYDGTNTSGRVIVPTTALTVGRVEFTWKRALTTGCHVVLSGAATVNVLVG